MLDRANKLNAPPRQLIRRHYRKHRRDNAPARAFAGARLWMRHPVVPSTQAEAARLVGSTPAWAAPVAAADIEDARRARSCHGRRQALHCDCGAEDAARRIEVGPDLANLPLAAQLNQVEGVQ